jgi:hypothetical protein
MKGYIMGQHSNEHPEDFVSPEEWDEHICSEYEKWSEDLEWGPFEGPEPFTT